LLDRLTSLEVMLKVTPTGIFSLSQQQLNAYNSITQTTLDFFCTSSLASKAPMNAAISAQTNNIVTSLYGVVNRMAVTMVLAEFTLALFAL